MRLLIHSRFYPNVGGIETVASILAHEWTAAGVDVSVITDVPACPEEKKVFPFPVYHRPGPRLFLRLVRA